jgi:hypothetical protein
MTRAAALLFLASLTACASSTGGSASSVGSAPIRSQGSVGRATDTRATLYTQTLAYPVDQVWRALPGVFDSLKVPLNTLDPKAHTIGNDGFKIRQRLGTVALSKYIDCGTTQIGPNADSYDIVLTVLVQLSPAEGGGTSVTTTFESSARPLAFAQEYSKCTSKSVFEPRLLEVLKGKLLR